jgi:hypothetical protein
VQRPDFYFTSTPKTLSYRIERPAQFDGELHAVIASVLEQIGERERQAAVELAAQRRSVLGVKAVRATSPLAAPSTPQPHGNRNPHLAAGGDREAMRTGVQALRAFRNAYRAAWKQLKAGVLTLFPGGTLLLRKRFGVACEPLEAACFCLLAT